MLSKVKYLKDTCIIIYKKIERMLNFCRNDILGKLNIRAKKLLMRDKMISFCANKTSFHN